MGYHRAGFDVTGVDINPQPNYPFKFYQADALTFSLTGFDVVHASPPCQAHCNLSSNRGHIDLISATRAHINSTHYVIENVQGAPLVNPIMLCGSTFGMVIQRHRLFETSILDIKGTKCCHEWWQPLFFQNDYSRKDTLSKVVAVYGSSRFKGDFELRCAAMGITWMNLKELSQAIPPVYTLFIGRQIKEFLCQKNKLQSPIQKK